VTSRDDHERVRLVVIAFAALSLLLVPLAAAEVSPKALVLQQADVPRGFMLDARKSGLRPNSTEAKSDAEARRMLARAGRVTGYENEFERRDEAMISSRADVLSNADGARFVLSWIDREARTSGIRGLKRSAVRIGAEGWLYTGGSPFVLTFVIWRHDRVFAGVAGTLVSTEQVVRLARVQQRRIAAALR
jgi:hypothetical protein